MDPIDIYSQIKTLVVNEISNAIKSNSNQAMFGVFPIPAHEHTGVDSSKLSYLNLEDIPTSSLTVCGKIYLSNTQNIPNTSLTTINLDTSSIAVGVTVDTSGHKLIALTDGYYAISGQVCWTQTTDAKNYASYVYLNGSTEIITGFAHASTTGNYGLTSPLNSIVHLSVNDYIQLKVSQVSGGYQSVGTDVNNTYLTMFKIN